MPADGSSSNSQWSHLPSNILQLLVNRLNNNLDQGPSDNCGSLSIHNLRLRSICKSWRSSIPARHKKTTPTILPFPIFPNHKLSFLPSEGHFTLYQSTIYLLQRQQYQSLLPNSIEPYWLLRVEEDTSSHRNSSGEKWRPVYPLSRTLTTGVEEQKQILLPTCFPKSINLLDFHIFEIGRAYDLDFVPRISQEDNDCIGKVAVSSISFITNDAAASEVDCLVVMAICGLKLGFIKLGDKKWTPIDDPKNSEFSDVVFHSGKFYAVDYLGRVVSIGPDLKAKEIAPARNLRAGEYKNLVTCCGDLFMIDTNYEPERFMVYDPFFDDSFKVQTDPARFYKLNEEKKEWEPVFDLNNHVFFVGYDCSFSVSARDFGGLKPNCVYYFADDSYMDCNEENKLEEFFTGIGVYDLHSGSCGPLSNFPDHWHIFMPSLTLGSKDNKMSVDGTSSNVVESQWSHLPHDLLELLADRLNNNLDQGSSDNCGALSIHNLRLRSVCKSWRSSIPA